MGSGSRVIALIVIIRLDFDHRDPPMERPEDNCSDDALTMRYPQSGMRAPASLSSFGFEDVRNVTVDLDPALQDGRCGS